MGYFGGRRALACAFLAWACGGHSSADSHGDATGGSLGTGGSVSVGDATGGVHSIITSSEGGAVAAQGGAVTASGGSDSSTVAEAGAGGDKPIDLGIGAGDLTVLVVFDKSGSMADRWDDRSKWQVANEAFMKAIEGVLDNLTIGAIFFPVPGNCDVASFDDPTRTQIDFMSGHALYDYWQATAETRVPGGSTPLQNALSVADTAIQQARGLGLLEDRFRVVLVTDGEPTCSDDNQKLVSYASSWLELGVHTVVMGLPGSSGALKLLDDIAAAGGTEKSQSLGTPGELDKGLFDAVR